MKIIKTVVLLLMLAWNWTSDALEPEINDGIFGQVLKIGRIEISILPDGGIGGATCDGILLWDQVYCALLTLKWKVMGKTSMALETKTEINKLADGVQIIAEGIIGKADNGQWNYKQTIFAKNDSTMELHYSIKQLRAPKDTLRYIYVNIETPVSLYANSNTIIESLDGQVLQISDFKFSGKAKSISFSTPAPGWTLSPGNGLNQVQLTNWNWTCRTAMMTICYTQNSEFNMMATFDFSKINNK